MKSTHNLVSLKCYFDSRLHAVKKSIKHSEKLLKQRQSYIDSVIKEVRADIRDLMKSKNKLAGMVSQKQVNLLTLISIISIIISLGLLLSHFYK